MKVWILTAVFEDSPVGDDDNYREPTFTGFIVRVFDSLELAKRDVEQRLAQKENFQTVEWSQVGSAWVTGGAVSGDHVIGHYEVQEYDVWDGREVTDADKDSI